MHDVDDESREHRLASLRDRLQSGLDRRTFLRTVAGSGYALGMASVLGVEDFLSVEDGEVPIVTALVREDPNDPTSLEERTTAVPAQWYASVSKAFDIHDRIADAAIPGYLGSSVDPGAYGHASARISLDISTDELRRAPADVYDLLPRIGVDWDGTLEGISISVEDVNGVEALEDGTDDVGEPHVVGHLDVDPVPGGVLCETAASTATLAPAVYDPAIDQSFFATAQHAYEDTDEPDGRSLFLSNGDDELVELGTVVSQFPVEDIVTVSPSGSLRPGSRIQRATNETVVGQFTRWGLADLAARGESLEKVGARTKRTTGEISGVDAVSCITGEFCRRGQLKWGEETDMGDGDSGSVSYHPDPPGVDGVIVASINNARTWWPGQNYMWGTAAYQITERTGYHF